MHIRRLAKTRGVYIGSFAPHHAAENNHRMIGLHYATRERGGRTKPLGSAVVDLYTGELAEFVLADTQSEKQMPDQAEGGSHGNLG